MGHYFTCVGISTTKLPYPISEGGITYTGESNRIILAGRVRGHRKADIDIYHNNRMLDSISTAISIMSYQGNDISARGCICMGLTLSCTCTGISKLPCPTCYIGAASAEKLYDLINTNRICRYSIKICDR